eukprot:TRINITY_DN1175_c0_g1_i1.p1 TRINITY_DN1175_c0_g1~~TRINITY_DN1175_c0_g1_i1.p1  ORF type:complete len:138 (+),score=46.09 TRINITY_DN1175_c0_g1_i1:222-635(+)
MDIISQLQEQVNLIAGITFNTIGTLQRDAPPVRLSPNYPEVQASSTEDPNAMAEQPKSMTTALIQASKQFEALVDALPLSEEGEELQLKRIAELKEENEAVGEELQKELEAAELELKQIQELFNMTADNYLNLKSPN